ncbi:hypothetical protein MferCBS31731_005584 [Microsporum ferrugineum]
MSRYAGFIQVLHSCSNMGAGLKPKEKDYCLPFEKAMAIFNEKTGEYEPVSLVKKKKAASIRAITQPTVQPKVLKKARAAHIFDKLHHLKPDKDGKLAHRPFTIRKVRKPQPELPAENPLEKQKEEPK